MNRGKKLFALLLAAVMILAMGMTGFAANGKPQASDRADVTITGITGDPTVTLYQGQTTGPAIRSWWTTHGRPV